MNTTTTLTMVHGIVRKLTARITEWVNGHPGSPTLRPGSPDEVASVNAGGSAVWEVPSGVQIGDGNLVIITAGPMSPTISTPSGFVQLAKTTTGDGVTHAAYWQAAYDGSPDYTFEFPDENVWVMVVYTFQAGSFEDTPAISDDLQPGINPNPPSLTYGWTGNTFAVTTFGTVAGAPDPSAYPFPNNQVYTVSDGGGAAGFDDVAGASCTMLTSGAGINPGIFTYAGTNECGLFTIGVKGVF